jgi:hypothetical protein
MMVAQTEFTFSDQDWQLAKEHSAFQHREACEFIFYVAEIEFIHGYESEGFSAEFLQLCREAKESGFKYICVFS